MAKCLFSFSENHIDKGHSPFLSEKVSEVKINISRLREDWRWIFIDRKTIYIRVKYTIQQERNKEGQRERKKANRNRPRVQSTKIGKWANKNLGTHLWVCAVLRSVWTWEVPLWRHAPFSPQPENSEWRLFLYVVHGLPHHPSSPSQQPSFNFTFFINLAFLQQHQRKFWFLAMRSEWGVLGRGATCYSQLMQTS